MHGVMSLGLFEGWQTKVMSKSEKRHTTALEQAVVDGKYTNKQAEKHWSASH